MFLVLRELREIIQDGFFSLLSLGFSLSLDLYFPSVRGMEQGELRGGVFFCG